MQLGDKVLVDEYSSDSKKSVNQITKEDLLGTEIILPGKELNRKEKEIVLGALSLFDLKDRATCPVTSSAQDDSTSELLRFL